MRQSNKTWNLTRTVIGTVLLLALSGAGSAAHADTAINGKSGKYPIVLDKSGTYKLTADLTVPAGLDGIVLAPGVNAVINMDGFSITGPAVCSQDVNCYQFNGTAGIQIQPGNVLTVSNGTVSGFTEVGVGDPNTFNFSHLIATNMRVFNNGVGMRAYLLMAENVFAQENSGLGIGAEEGSVVRCHAVANSQGIFLGLGTVSGSVASFNTGIGFLFQRTPNQDNSTFANGTAAVGVGAFSPGLNNNYN